MKADHQLASENPDQTVCIPEDREGPSQARSYECTFCKKSFSNAQALGGHMNIHRKEKAKLKEAPHETQHLFNIPYATNIVKPLELTSSQVKSTTKRPWDFSSSEDCSRSPRIRTDEGEVKQLPRIDETVQRDNSSEPTSQAVENFQETLPSSQGDVDLELRLGHEPRESSDTMRARNFF